jgi:hypothetical protein
LRQIARGRPPTAANIPGGAMNSELEFLVWLEGEVTKLRLATGDIAVLSTDMVLTAEQSHELYKRFGAVVGADNKILVLSRGLKVSVMTRAEIESKLQ